MNNSSKSAVVTGVSTGIGKAIAQALVDAGWHVFGSVRKVEDGAKLSTEFGDRFTPLVFDVTDKDAIGRESARVGEALDGCTLSALINNAGVAVGGPLGYLPLEELQRQMDINLYGPLRVIQAFLPMLGADHERNGSPGKIINMSSVAGQMASPFMGPYAMSKHALEALSESLRRELFVHGIDVIVIAPGAIKTPIWAKADELNVDQYAGTEYFDLLTRMREAMQAYGDEGLPAETVGELALQILENPRPRTRYAILKNKFLMWTLPRLLPKRMVDCLVAKRFNIKPRSKT